MSSSRPALSTAIAASSRASSATSSTGAGVAVAVSLACLLLTDTWRTVIQVRSQQSLYLALRRPSPALEACALLNLLLFSGVIFLINWVLIGRPERAGDRPRHIVPILIGAISFWNFAAFIIDEAFRKPAHTLPGGLISFGEPARFSVLPSVLLAFVVGPLTLWRPRQTWKTIEAAALILFPFAVLCIGQTSRQAFYQPMPPEGRHSATAALPASRKPLVFWIVFDEMDQGAVFHQTLGHLDLPNLTALRQTSVYAEHAIEVSDMTTRVIPSYTVGREVKTVRWDSTSDLMLQFEGSASFVPWTKQRTLFRDAADAGRRTAVLGYFHPYCRLFSEWAADCRAFPYSEAGDLQKWWNTLQDLPLPWAVLLQAKRAMPLPNVVTRFDGERFRLWQLAVLRDTESQHARVMAQMREAILDVAADPLLDFVYFHAPLPHPPALTAMPNGKPIPQPDYTSDLKAADQMLGEIRATLTKAGRWDDASVVVTSDHTVRNFWAGSLFLTPSLLEAIRSVKERSVPLLVKLPRQTTPLAYEEPISAILVHGIVEKLLRGDLREPNDVAGYLRANRLSKETPTSSR